jgi:hypothetical protein
LEQLGMMASALIDLCGLRGKWKMMTKDPSAECPNTNPFPKIYYQYFM